MERLGTLQRSVIMEQSGITEWSGMLEWPTTLETETETLMPPLRINAPIGHGIHAGRT